MTANTSPATPEQIEIRINLPRGYTPEEVEIPQFGRGDYRPSDKFLDNGGCPTAGSGSSCRRPMPYAAGASFPKDLVAASIPAPPVNPQSPWSPLFCVLLPSLLCVSLAPFWIIIMIVIFAVRNSRKRLKEYLPPKIGIESGGIKRGLTPAEAALLQELPLPRVLLLIIFGLLKKDMLGIKEIADRDFRFTAQKKEGLEALDYEKEFMAAIDADKRLNKSSLRTLFTDMIKGLQTKMAGFSRRETNMYYQSIMNKAWDQVKNAPKEKLPEELADSLEWLAMDPEYENKLEPYANDTILFPGRTAYWYRNFPAAHNGDSGRRRAGQGARQERHRRGREPRQLPAGVFRRPARRQRRLHLVHHQGDQPAPGAALSPVPAARWQQLRLRLCLRRLRLRLRRRWPMKQYDLKKTLAVLLGAVAVAAFAAFAAARFVRRRPFPGPDPTRIPLSGSIRAGWRE